ncbi:MAG: alcohol dehydrogenase catalytic domain-containing protein [Actinobacteria bacterium]|nr:alcohol dehydrogenase catalytic domain-containing protein [Actinomycetota bacterium]
MRAVVFASGGVEVAEVAEPKVLEPTDAVVEVSLSAICGSDLHLLDGKTPGMREGGVIGHEFVGHVVAAGAHAGAHPEGTRVVGSFLIVCGACVPCRERRFNHCTERRALGLGTLTGDLDGAQAERVRVPVADVNLTALTDAFAEILDEQAIFCGDVLATGIYAAHLAEGGPGDTVVVIGAGPVGLLCAASVRALGARAIVLDADPHRVEFARERMDLEALDVSEADAGEAIAEATGGAMAAATIEAVGHVSAFRSAMRTTANGGRVVIVGVYGSERYELPMGMAWIRGLDLRFSGMANVQAHWIEALTQVASGAIEPDATITHRMPLDEAVEGYRLFAAREAMKVILTPS